MKRSKELACLLSLGVILALLFWSFLRNTHEAAAVGPDQNTRAEPQISTDLPLLDVPTPERTSALLPMPTGTSSSDGLPGAMLEPTEVATGAIWSLVAELEALAANSETFHRLALPVIERLTHACQDHQQSNGETEESEPIARLLLNELVLVPERNDLVRGAVFLSIATLLPAEEFERTFIEWFDGGETSFELLRSAGTAAALRGEAFDCGMTLDLSFLGRFQTGRDETLPHIYPLRLKRMIRMSESEAIRSWFQAMDSTRRLILPSSRTDSPEEQARLQDFVIASELLFALRGHRALVDSEIEDLLLERTSQISIATAQQTVDLVDFRATVFLVHSLAICSNTMLDLTITMSESKDPLLSSLSGQMEGVVSGGFGVALLSKLENLRYAEKKSDRIELFLSLSDAGESLSAMPDPTDFKRSVAYLDSFALDRGVDHRARAAAIGAIAEADQWEVFSKSARTVLLANDPGTVQVSAMSYLVNWPSKDPSTLAEVLAILEEVALASPIEKIRRQSTSYIDQLSN